MAKKPAKKPTKKARTKPKPPVKKPPVKKKTSPPKKRKSPDIRDDAARMDAIIEAFKTEGHIMTALRVANLSWTLYARLKQDSTEFQRRLLEAQRECNGKVETGMFKRALAGDQRASEKYLEKNDPKKWGGADVPDTLVVTGASVQEGIIGVLRSFARAAEDRRNREAEDE
jgi:hypothetical protein